MIETVKIIIMKLIIVLFSILILFVGMSCDFHNPQKEIKKIELIKAFNKKQNIYLSTIAEKIEYIQLESAENFIVGNATRAFADDDYLVVISFRQQYIFNRKTGEFIREIGNYGRDSNGYRNTKFNLAYNEKKKTLYAAAWDNGIIEYSINGEVLNKIAKPNSINAYRSFTSINDSIYISYVPNYSGKDSVKLVTVNQKGELLSVMPNHNFFKDNPKRVSNWGDKEGWFIRFKEKLLLKELNSDTIFEIKGNTIYAKYIFNCGRYKPDYYNRDYVSDEELKDYFWVQNIFESAKFIFFTLSFNEELRAGIYDKKKNTAFIADSDTVDSFYYHWKKYGFINDFDNFIQFNPEYINSEGEIVGLIQAYELVNWFKNNPQKAAKLPPHLQKFKNIKETDNPIIMIAKLKE